MVKAIRVHQHGGPEVMKWEDVELGGPKDGEIKVKNKAIGINYTDIYMRKGLYYSFPADGYPFTPAAGATGSLFCQWANALGATVIGTVSTKEKALQAREDGCHHVILYKEENFVDRVSEITNGQGVEVVYDSVGKDTFEGSLACLKTRGYLVLFGMASGQPDLSLRVHLFSLLSGKLLFVTFPVINHYTAKRAQLVTSAADVYANVASGVLRARINHKYPLSQAAKAHADLEDRKTSGSILLIPDDINVPKDSSS